MNENERNYLNEALEIIKGSEIPVEKEHLLALSKGLDLMNESLKRVNQKMAILVQRINSKRQLTLTTAESFAQGQRLNKKTP